LITARGVQLERDARADHDEHDDNDHGNVGRGVRWRPP